MRTIIHTARVAITNWVSHLEKLHQEDINAESADALYMADTTIAEVVQKEADF